MTAGSIRFPEPRQPAGAAQLRQEVRDFLAEEDFEPRCDAWLGGFDPDFSRRLAARGWVGMTWPKRYGGQERSSLDRHVVIEELLAAGAPVAAHWVSDRQTGPMLLRYGTERQRTELLSRMARGECYFAIGMSEPDSGSDLASIRTTAARVDGGWLVNGAKVWTSHAHRAHYMLTLVRTSRAGISVAEGTKSKHHGTSQLIIDMHAPGVEVRPIRLLTGHHHFNEVLLRDAFVPDGMLVGEEGAGWDQVVSELAFERSGPERLLSTYPLFVELLRRLANPDDREAERTGRLVARLLPLRRLSLSVANAIEAGAAPTAEAALVKDAGTRFEKEVIDAARDIGCDSELMRRLIREAVLSAPGFTLRGGTSEILRGIVARGLSGR